MAHAGTRSTTKEEELRKLVRAISATSVQPFLVTLHQSPHGSTKLKVYFAREALRSPFVGTKITPRLIKRSISHEASAVGLDVAIRVKFISRYALDKPRSLEGLMAKFELGEWFSDPTGVFEEAERLIQFAGELRSQFGGDLKGTYWSSRRRTTYVLLNEQAFMDGYWLQREKLIAAERLVMNVHQACANRNQGDLPDRVVDVSSDRFEAGASRNVRLCFDAPVEPLVPIDKASFKQEHARRLGVPGFRRLLKLATDARIPLLGALLSVGSGGMAQAKLPQIESKPTLAGSETAVAAPTMPARDARNELGSPSDAVAVVSSVASDLFPGGPGLHLFWRDPIHGAVGRNTSFHPYHPRTEPAPTSQVPSSSKELIDREHFFEAARSAATFSAPGSVSGTRTLDLAWADDGKRLYRSAADGSAGASESSELTAIEPAVKALLGLSRHPSDEDYGAVLQDLQAHFGLPLAEMRWSSGQSTDLSPRSVLMDANESYWEWLRRIAATNVSTKDGVERSNQRFFDNPSEVRRRGRGSSV